MESLERFDWCERFERLARLVPSRLSSWIELVFDRLSLVLIKEEEI